MVAAAIRFNNPGAMWGKGNPIATKWGATGTTTLNDGLGQGNNIAFFPTKLQGACAQFDLWRHGYCNRTLRQAILKWSGGNWSAPYADEMSRVSGIGLDEMITPSVLASSRGWRLMKTQAKWEAGQPYPLTDAEWVQAQTRVFGGVVTDIAPVTKKKAAAATGVVVATGAAAGQAASSGHHWGIIFGLLILGAAISVGVWVWIHQRHEVATAPPAPRPIPPQPLTLEQVQAALDKDLRKGS